MGALFTLLIFACLPYRGSGDFHFCEDSERWIYSIFIFTNNKKINKKLLQ